MSLTTKNQIAAHLVTALVAGATLYACLSQPMQTVSRIALPVATTALGLCATFLATEAMGMGPKSRSLDNLPQAFLISAAGITGLAFGIATAIYR